MREPAPAAVLSFQTPDRVLAPAAPCALALGAARNAASLQELAAPPASGRCGRTGPAESRRGRRGQSSRVGPAGGLASLCAHEGCGPSVPPAAQPGPERQRLTGVAWVGAHRPTCP